MFAYDMCYQLYLSAFDMECHIRFVPSLICSRSNWKKVYCGNYFQFDRFY